MMLHATKDTAMFSFKSYVPHHPREIETMITGKEDIELSSDPAFPMTLFNLFTVSGDIRRLIVPNFSLLNARDSSVPRPPPSSASAATGAASASATPEEAAAAASPPQLGGGGGVCG
jgi:hypothetical protein